MLLTWFCLLLPLYYPSKLFACVDWRSRKALLTPFKKTPKHCRIITITETSWLEETLKSSSPEHSNGTNQHRTQTGNAQDPVSKVHPPWVKNQPEMSCSLPAHVVYSQRLLFAAGALCGQEAVLEIRLFEFVNLINSGRLAWFVNIEWPGLGGCFLLALARLPGALRFTQMRRSLWRLRSLVTLIWNFQMSRSSLKLHF